jgi:hypothetical protein
MRIERDPVDVRDLIYRPSLSLLPGRYLCATLDPSEAPFNSLFMVRQQHDKPSCVGEALAALIDLQRIETFRLRKDADGAKSNLRPVSAAMLYTMALEIESSQAGRRVEDVFSLRSGLKGFYNAGVCSEDTWTGRPLAAKGPLFDSTSIAVSREARGLTLGAYYRVRSFINDMHAALVEAGALYVSAEVHGGWSRPTKGVIGPAKGGRYGHAFVVVGYEERGFLVLNSWGPDWGRYRYAKGPPLPGIALWPYEDWAAHVLDAWVLRLAAPTPDAFRFALGPQGAAMFGADQPALGAPSVRRIEVLGHYLHLDDGKHVTSGAYPSSPRSFATTLTHLSSAEKDSLRHIRLTLHGDTRRPDEVMRRVAAEIAEDKANGIHGISLIWANGLISGAAEALRPLFDNAAAISAGNKDDADERIERMTRPVGRALWRDVRRQAKVAAETNGHATLALRALIELCKATGKRLHLQTEGAGVLLLEALLAGPFAKGPLRAALIDALESVTLVAPLIAPAAFNAKIGPLLEAWGVGRALIFRPDGQFDDRLCVGAYSRSWTDLVARAFEDRPTEASGPLQLVGSHDFAGKLRGAPKFDWLRAPERPSGDLSSTAVLLHKEVRANALKTR